MNHGRAGIEKRAKEDMNYTLWQGTRSTDRKVAVAFFDTFGNVNSSKMLNEFSLCFQQLSTCYMLAPEGSILDYLTTYTAKRWSYVDFSRGYDPADLPNFLVFYPRDKLEFQLK